MGRIVVSENVTLDGIMQDPVGNDGFKFGGWFEQMPDTVRAEWAEVEYQEALDTATWVVGRGTFFWLASARPGPWADRPRPAQVCRVLDDQDTSAQANSSVLAGEVVERVTKMKQNVDGDILVYGGSRLVPTADGA